MAQLTWQTISPLDTSKYLDAIQKANAQSLAGVEQIGNAYKGYHDNLKKQNTNDMLTALNQAQSPEELAIAQANIAAMQQRWGTGYDMDAVRTAVDERPTVLMQRQSAEMDFTDKKANRDARPQASAIRMAQLKTLGATEEQLAQIKAMDGMGADSSAIAESLGQYLTNDRKFKFDKEWKEKEFNQDEDHFTRNLKQRQYEFGETNRRANLESALNAGKTLYEADQSSGAGTTYVAADGTEFTTGGGGGAAIARYASQFGPLAAGMVQTESSGNPNAVSPAGARGIIQIMPATAANPGYGMSPIDLKNSTPEEQIRWGMEYRSRLKQHHGFDDDQATAAFNAGAGRVEQAINQAKKSGGNWLSYLPKETRDYVPRVNAATAKYANGGSVNAASNTPATAPLVGIDRKVQQKIRAEYQDAMLKYNEDLALKNQPVNVGNVLAGLTAKEEGSFWTQDAFDIVNALKDNPQLAGLSAEGITNVYNRAKAWQAKPKVPLIGYNSSAGLKGSIDNFIKDELNNDIKRKEHVAKASHPSNIYAQKIQQAFEEKGVSISAKEALLHIDPARYESLYGKPTVKVQEAVEKKVEKVAATATPAAKASQATTAAAATAAVATAAKPKPAPQTATSKTSSAKDTNPPKVTPFSSSADKAAMAKWRASHPKPSKQDLVDFYVKRGKVDNVVPAGLLTSPVANERDKDRELIRQAKAEATKQLAAKEAREKAAKEAKKAKERAELARVRKDYEEYQKQMVANQRIKAAAKKASNKPDMEQLYKEFAHRQSLSIANAARKAKEEEERKRK